MTRPPDFLIVGAPKCGTSSLYRWLRQHPAIFMPDLKEPHFFGQDLNGWREWPDADAYRALFGGHTEQLCGEASTWYLYSTSAAEEIAAANPDTRIIAMVRDPVEMVPALHGQLLYDGFHEDLRDLGEALRAEPERRRGRRLPATCRRPEALRYTDVARYTPQLDRYFARFGDEQVHVVVFDDLREDAAETYRHVLRFLDVDPGFTPPLGAANASRRVRSRAVQDALRSAPARRAARIVPRRVRARVRHAAKRANSRHAPREPVTSDVVEWIRAGLRDDVRRLEAMLGRDLSHWLAR